MNKFKLLAVSILLLGGYGASAQAALVDIMLTPADCNIGVNCWTSNDPSNIDADDVEEIVGTSIDLTSYYKQNVGEANDTGLFAGSYETTFSNTANDPEDALIELISGQDPITCGTCYLVVKDGNQEPSTYIFDLSLAGMINSIELEDFWPNQGAISHVEIFSGISEVPVPAAVWLFGTALIGFIGISRRRNIA